MSRVRRARRSALQRWWSFVRLSHGGCWEWLGSIDDDGYGRFWLEGRWRRAHDVGYELLVGPIPDGLQPDHICRNRACSCPDHLELVTSRENTLRGEGPAAVNARRVECVNGHPFDEKNTWRSRKTGKRVCRTCGRDRKRRQRSKAAA